MISTIKSVLAAGVAASCLLIAAPAVAEFSTAPYSLPPTPGTSGGPDALVSITHSLSNTVTSGNSVSCNSGGIHVNNSYWRTFNLTAFGITDPLDILSLDLGIELAVAGSGGSQPATIRYYTDTDTNPGNGGLSLIGTVPIVVPDASLTVLNFAGGPSGVPVGSNLVVEVFTPDGTAGNNAFFIGSNSLGQTGASYLSAADCGVNSPTPTSAIGFPGMHIVMTVNGNTVPVPEPAGLGLTAAGLFGLTALRRRRAGA
jgi:hypothetical protein